MAAHPIERVPVQQIRNFSNLTAQREIVAIRDEAVKNQRQRRVDDRISLIVGGIRANQMTMKPPVPSEVSLKTPAVI